jgi:hypothetical protein
MIFGGWYGPLSASPYDWKLLSNSVSYVWDDHWQDVFQIRHFSFYFFKVLITCLNFMGFFLELFSDRLANNVSLSLSALPLLYVVGEELPQTTFLTAKDIIVLVTLSLIYRTSIHFVYLGSYL